MTATIQWRLQGRSRLKIGPLAAGFVAVLTMALSGCSGQVGTADLAVPTISAPFATSLETSSGTWLVVPLGVPHSSTGTFWQLFYEPSASLHWSLVTPPGVASNAALDLTSNGAAGSALEVGFEPSQLLGFSPLASTTDHGREWGAASLPAALVNVPDALTVNGGSLDALVATNGGSILRGLVVGSTQYVTIATSRELAVSTGGRLCGAGSFTALASSGGSLFAGTTCTAGGEVGLFQSSGNRGDSWQLAGPHLSASLDSDTTKVLTLLATPAYLTGLVAVSAGTTTEIVSIWRGSTGTWTISPPLGMGAGAVLVAAGVTPSGMQWLVQSSPSDGQQLDSVTPGGAWQVVTGLPSDTAAVAFAPNGALTAAVGGVTSFTSWQRQAGSKWAVREHLEVPVPIGSSG